MVFDWIWLSLKFECFYRLGSGPEWKTSWWLVNERSSQCRNEGFDKQSMNWWIVIEWMTGRREYRVIRCRRATGSNSEVRARQGHHRSCTTPPTTASGTDRSCVRDSDSWPTANSARITSNNRTTIMIEVLKSTLTWPFVSELRIVKRWTRDIRIWRWFRTGWWWSNKKKWRLFIGRLGGLA